MVCQGAPANLTVLVDANNSVFPVQRVELLTNGNVVAVDDVPPYEFALSNLSVGEYELVARATDASDDVTSSAPVSVRVDYPEGRATFYRMDTATMGAWAGPWGHSGHVVFGASTNLPASAGFDIAPGQVYVAHANSSAPWALFNPNGPD